MKIIDPGHTFEVQNYDAVHERQIIDFMKREGAGYPGNVGAHGGTNLQEMIRVIISRTKYLNNQIPCVADTNIINAQRLCLQSLEVRACVRHGINSGDLLGKMLVAAMPIEEIPACPTCGHLVCHHG